MDIRVFTYGLPCIGVTLAFIYWHDTSNDLFKENPTLFMVTLGYIVSALVVLLYFV